MKGCHDNTFYPMYTRWVIFIQYKVIVHLQKVKILTDFDGKITIKGICLDYQIQPVVNNISQIPTIMILC